MSAMPMRMFLSAPSRPRARVGFGLLLALSTLSGAAACDDSVPSSRPLPEGLAELSWLEEGETTELRVVGPPDFIYLKVFDDGRDCEFFAQVRTRAEDLRVTLSVGERDAPALLAGTSSASISARAEGLLADGTVTALRRVVATEGDAAGRELTVRYHSIAGQVRVTRLPELAQEVRVDFDQVVLTRDAPEPHVLLSGTVRGPFQGAAIGAVITEDGVKAGAGVEAPRACPQFRDPDRE